MEQFEFNLFVTIIKILTDHYRTKEGSRGAARVFALLSELALVDGDVDRRRGVGRGRRRLDHERSSA